MQSATTLPVLFLLAIVGSQTPALAGGTSATQALAQCKSIDCLRATIPRDKGKLLGAGDCKAVEGRNDPLDSDLELGLVCRVLVARAQAAFRQAAPCVNSGGVQPDWDAQLENVYDLDLQSLQIAEAPFKRRGIKLERGEHPISGAPRFGTTAFHRNARMGERFVEHSTYFCIAEKPRRYVPFYYSLRIGDEMGEGPIAEEQAVNTSDAIPVLRQSRQFHHPDDQRVFVLADLNGDKKEDIAVLRHKTDTKQYSVAVCLFNPKGPDCVPVVVREPITIDKSPTTLHLEAEKNGTLHLTATESARDPVGEWRLRLIGADLKLIAK